MKNITAQEFLADLKTGRPIKIKIFSMGENIGQDYAYFCHYYSLKKAFPNIILDLVRGQVAETNLLGFQDYQNIVDISLDSIHEVQMYQWYPDGRDWLQKIRQEQWNIIPAEYRDLTGYDYYWGINVGDSPIWTKQFPSDFPFLKYNVIQESLAIYNKESPEVFNKTQPLKDIPSSISKIKGGWERTACEYLCCNEPDYPFSWKDNKPNYYNDCLHIGLRWPDMTRWYYSLEDQMDLVRKIIGEIKARNRHASIIYNLKDMWLGVNFNRGQTIQWLQWLNDNCDDILFTYCWNPVGMPGRPSLQTELMKLKRAGITALKQVNVWEELKMAYDSKVYLAEPAGFSEVIYMVRAKKGDSTFVFPTCSKCGDALISKDNQGRIIKLKVNEVIFDTLYDCDATMSLPDVQGQSKVLSWRVAYDNIVNIMPIGYPGDDTAWFNSLINTTYKEFAERSKPILIDAIVSKYLE